MKFLAAIRFDSSDGAVFDRVAEEGEFVVSGAFAFADRAPDSMTGKTRQEYRNGLLGVPSFGRTSFASVTGIAEPDRDALVATLAAHFVTAYGAPDLDAARPAALEEVAFVADLCAGLSIGQLVAVSRSFDADGHLREAFRVIDKPTSCAEGGAWQIVESDA